VVIFRSTGDRRLFDMFHLGDGQDDDGPSKRELGITGPAAARWSLPGPSLRPRFLGELPKHPCRGSRSLPSSQRTPAPSCSRDAQHPLSKL
jgi:hypothetical protein